MHIHISIGFVVVVTAGTYNGANVRCSLGTNLVLSLTIYIRVVVSKRYLQFFSLDNVNR